MRSSLTWLFLALAIFFNFTAARAESIASKNKKGNQFYTQGKYADAEKEYLDAQVNNPGNPKILYNLGNSLIRQKKYSQGIQALNQAIEKGNRAEKGNSWYNEGNALYAEGKFKDSAEAFIQALKVNPADKDAKHNLELALLKLKQQQSKQSNPDADKKNSENSNQNKPSPGKEDKEKTQNQNRDIAEQQGKQQNEPPKRENNQASRREGSVSKEKAQQILDAVQNQEIEEQRKMIERRARQQSKGKDW
jgi:Ca-activated chloride channel homolog